MKRSRDDGDGGSGGGDDGSGGGLLRSSVRPQTSGGSANKLTTMDALTYLKEIRETFKDQKDKYDEFLEAMKDFKAHRVDTPSIIARVRRLFEGYPDLILGFNTFLPKEYAITMDEPQAKKPVEFNEAFLFVNKIKKRFEGDERSYSSFLSILSMYRNNIKSVSEIHQEVAALLHNQPDLLEEFANFLPSGHNVHPSSKRNHNTSLPAGAIRPRHPEKKRAVSVEIPRPHREDGFNRHAKKEKMRREDREHRSQDRGFDHHGTNRLTHNRKPASAFEDSAPSLKKLEDSVTELFHQAMRDEVLCLREKVKKRLNDSDNYGKFLSCILHYHTGNITRSNLENLVNDILGAYPDLMEEVNGFIDRSGSAGSLWSGNLPESVKADDEDQDRERDGKNVSVIKEEYQAKPIHELDLSNCEQCGPSYRRLPKDYPIPKVSGRTKVGAKVLNDHWVSVTSGSEDYSFKHMRKNQYEESLFRCEDDRYELDMLIESATAAAQSVEELLKKIDNKFFKTDSEIIYEDHLSVLNLRCIERLYGDNGLDVLDILKKNAALALPVILTRLKQKKEDWERCRFDFNKIWADIYAKNHHKSLDHRSFYFKQQDSKSLSAKALLAEIKEISEEKSKEETIYHHFATGKRSTTPHQEFEYCDLNVHEDLYKLIRYYVPHNSTSEQFDRIMNIWTTIVEPMFNVPPRPQLVNGDHEAVKTSKKENDSNGVKENGSHIKKVEREDGEFSPNGDFEEDNFTASRENGADEEGEESAHRSSCDTENPSENGEGSGSETADVEDHTPEDHDGVHDKKTESEGEEDETHIPFLETVKPLTKYVPETSHTNETDPRVFYGNDTFYVFFRLHHTLYSRLKEAKEKSSNGKWKGSNDTAPNDSYARFLDLLYSFLGGVIDSTKYEDDCRAILGTWSFPVFTLDKLIHKLSKQLLAIAADEVENKLIKLYSYEHMRKPGRFVDDLYSANARVIAKDETIYRFSHSLIPETNRQTRLTIRLMDSGCEASEAAVVSIDPNFVPYPDILPLTVIPGRKKAGAFLKRNKRKYVSEDEDLAMMKATEGLQILNGVQCKMDCSTYRVAYVLGTEDSMVRKGRKKIIRSVSPNELANLSNGYSHQVQKFRKLLQSRVPESM